MRKRLRQHRLAHAGLSIVALSVGLLSLSACARERNAGEETAEATGETQSEDPLAERPECPLHNMELAFPKDQDIAMTATGTVALAGLKSNIPEFHDCQRFFVERGTRYDSLYAIFAAEKLDSLDEWQHTPRYEGKALPAAEIISWHGTYAPLHIEPLFNCLYMWKEQEWKAAMLSVKKEEAACLQPVDRTDIRLKPLTVRTQSFGLPDSVYPPVARWDWDAEGMEQFISIKCGAAWCEIGSKTFKSAPTLVTTGLSTAEKRVRQIRGWYDYQYLSQYDPVSKKPVPSRHRGAVIPHPDLGTRQNADYESGWLEAAVVQLTDTVPGYLKKFNFRAGKNRIRLRKDGETWRAEVLPPTGASKILQVIFRDHTLEMSQGHFNIPGTARWRWMATDEKIWIRCPEGCCEVQDQ